MELVTRFLKKRGGAMEYHILVVEDEQYWREAVFCETLEEAGYQVRTCSTYNEAVAALDERVFDMLVIDVNLTGFAGNQDGVRVLERVAALGRKLPSVIVSGSKSRAMAVKNAEKFRPIAFLDKTTFDVTEFATLVADALANVDSRKV